MFQNVVAEKKSSKTKQEAKAPHVGGGKASKFLEGSVLLEQGEEPQDEESQSSTTEAIASFSFK
jgi:hypothetical protein